MPRKKANGEGSIYKRPNGMWTARITMGFDRDGKQQRKTVYGKTKSEVHAKIVKIQQELADGTYIAPTNITVEQWMNEWIATYNGGIKENSLERYKCHIRNHIIPQIGKIKLTALTTSMIQAFYNRCQEEGLSPKTIKALHGALHKALEKAVAVRYIRVNPSDACELPRVERKDIQPITGTQINAFLTAIEKDRYRDVYFVDLFTGLRQSEIIGLSWDCVDFEHNTIRVYRQLLKQRRYGAGSQWKFTPLKNDKQRMITVSSAVMNVLRRVQREQAQLKLASGGAWCNEDDLIFVNEQGGHIGSVALYNHFKKCAAEAGIPQVRFHDLRHSFATLSLQNGDDIKTVSENLGHATVAFTLDVYGHVTDEMRQASADRMQALIERVTGTDVIT